MKNLLQRRSLQFRGWLSRFNIKHNYSQPWYIDQIIDKLSMQNSMLDTTAREIR